MTDSSKPEPAPASIDGWVAELRSRSVAEGPSDTPLTVLAIKSKLECFERRGDGAALEKLLKEADRLDQTWREEHDQKARDAAIKLLDDCRAHVNPRAVRELTQDELDSVTGQVLWLLARVEEFGDEETREWNAYTEYDGTKRIFVEPELKSAIGGALRKGIERDHNGEKMLRAIARVLGADADNLFDYLRARRRK